MRIATGGTTSLSADGPGELGVSFECLNCESIHIAYPLPEKGSVPGGRRWSMVDAAVRWILGSLPRWADRDTANDRHANGMAVGAHSDRRPHRVGGKEVVKERPRHAKTETARSYAVMAHDFVNLVAQVHAADTGCAGPVTSDGATSESSANVKMCFTCCGCGARFGRLDVGGTNSLSTVLGVLLAGNSFTGLSASCQYSDLKVMGPTTFHRHQKTVLHHIERLFEEYLQSSNDDLRSDPARRIRVPIEDHCFLKNKTHLLARMDGRYGLELERHKSQQRGENLNAQECYDRAHIAKNLKNISKFAKGNGDRAVRNFVNASVRSRQVWLEQGGVEKTEWLWAEAFVEKFNHVAFHLQGNHSFCSKDCAGADDYTIAAGDPDGEMLAGAPTGGVDFFSAAMGDMDGRGEGDDSPPESPEVGKGGGVDFFSAAMGDMDGRGEGDDSLPESPEVGKGTEATGDVRESVESESEGDDFAGVPPEGAVGAGGVGGAEGVAAAVRCKAAPTVSLGGCKESAKTVPSLFKTLGVCKELFRAKKAAFHGGALQTRDAKQEAVEDAEAGAGVSATFEALEEETIREVERVCQEGWDVIHRTLFAAERAVRLLNPSITNKSRRHKLQIATADLRLDEELGEIIMSASGVGHDEVVHGPASLILTTKVKAYMIQYVKAVKCVVAAEAAVFETTGKRIMVTSERLRQTNTGTLRHLAWRESGPTTFFSPCANAAGENVPTKRTCSACAVQVLVNTACLRAFCFCVTIGTNALESFNGSTAAMVSRRSDFCASDVGRAQLALLKRCFPGGYAAVVSRLRQACELPPLSDEATAATLVQQRKAGQLHGETAVSDSASVRKAGEKKLKAKANPSVAQTKDGKLPKIANELGCAALQSNVVKGEGEGGGSGTTCVGGGAAAKSRKRNGLESADGLSVYDRSGSNSIMNLNESMVLPSATKKAHKKSTCNACEKFGIPVPRLLLVHHERASSADCAMQRKAWIDAGIRTTRTETPSASTPPTMTSPTPTAATEKSAAVASLPVTPAASTSTRMPGRGGGRGGGRAREYTYDWQIQRQNATEDVESFGCGVKDTRWEHRQG